MNLRNDWPVVFVALIVLAVAFALGGWIQDIVHFISCDFKPPYKAEILYGVGLLPAIGWLMGWFNFGK